MPHVSDYPDNASGVCILTGRSDDPQGFLNLETPVDRRWLGNPAVVSITRLREIASEEGVNMHTPQEVADLHERIQGLELERELAKMEIVQLAAENDALVTLVGPKLWGKAQHVKKAAGFWGRRQAEAIKEFGNDDITEAEFDDKLKNAQEKAEEALCSPAS